MNSSLKILVIACVLSGLAGCGGGGGGGGGGGAPATTDADITPENAVDIASDVYESIGETASLGDFGTSGLIGAAGPSSPTLSKSAATIAAKAGLAGTLDAGSLIAVAIGPEETPCAVSGTVTVSGDISNPETLSAGDTITLRFNNCDEGDGQVVNGNLTLTIDMISGDFATEFFALGATLDFRTFTVQEAGETTSVNGGFSIMVDTTGYPVTTASLSSPYLSVTDGSRTANLSNYSTTLTVDESSQPPAFSVTSSGRVDLPRRGGSVSFVVREPFSGFGEGNPDSGVLFIRGANGATINMTVLSDTQVRFDMDYDGDGSVDETVNLAWVDFES
ncbi:MAG: hypothetical protein AMJ59_28070 [Gammaproteobacteria bacterium SG8_31]|nr:MAG: hypothetical protein AMJ59_28070 [Gammaproteobacteria bacterium SG8_31]